MIQKVDIAICTWNRERLLAGTLESFKDLIIPPDVSIRFLIVDNGSTDGTSKVIEAFRDSEFGRAHQIQSLSEPKQGHSHSRNLAIENATGDILIWTDDDVEVSKEWVFRYVGAANSNPDVCFFGSAIEPIFEGGTPIWVKENWNKVKGCFAARDLGNQPIEFTPERLPYGANFAIRTEIQKRYPFNSSLGRSGDLVHGEDELELLRRILANSHRGLWIPNAAVRHQIPAERATQKYVYDYFVGQGRALVSKNEPWHKDVAALKKESRWNYLCYRTKRYFASSEVWVSHMLRAALAHGQSVELQRLADKN